MENIDNISILEEPIIRKEYSCSDSYNSENIQISVDRKLISVYKITHE